MRVLDRFLMVLVSCFALSTGVLAQAPSSYISILTGPSGGTYFEFGTDIKKLVFPEIDLEVLETYQSTNNIMSLSEPSDFQLAIVQQDILESDLARKLGGENIGLVMPLYLEEVHLLAGPSISSVSDLDGKKVAVGIHGSGTNFTAEAVLEKLGIVPERKLYLREWRALTALQQGAVDAMFYVVGAPAKFLNENVEEGRGIRLVPIALGAESPVYAPVQIPAGTYGWQADSVDTIAVGAWLVAPKLTMTNPDCTAIGMVALALRDNLEQLQVKGHSKWNQVVFDEQALRAHPRVSECVVKVLGTGSE